MDLVATRPDTGSGITPRGDGREIFDVSALRATAIHYRLLILACLAAGLALGAGAFLAQAPVYKATARLEVSAPTARVVEDLQVMNERSDQRAFQTAIEKLKSQPVLRRAVIALGLVEPGEGIDAREADMVRRLAAGLSISLLRNTSIIAVTYADTDPGRAQAVANGVAAAFIAQRASEIAETWRGTRQSVETQIVKAEDALQVSEAALVAYAKANRVGLFGTEDSLIAQNLRAINAALAEAVTARLAARSIVDRIDAGEGETLRDVLGDPGIVSLRGRLAELRATYQQKLRLFKPDYPDMRMLSGQIAAFESQIGDLTAAILSSLRQRLVERTASEDQLRARLASLEAEQSMLADRSINHTILERQVAADRVRYESLVTRLAQIEMGEDLTGQGVSIVDPAPLPKRAVTPRLPRNLFVGLVFGGVLAAAAIALRERLTGTFRRPDQVEQELGLPVIGTLPKVDPALVDLDLADPRSGLSEAYRSLCGALQFSGPLPRVLLVTSAEAGEGKTTTAASIAAGFAAMGERVLLIDADLRKPALHGRLGLRNTHGLGGILAGSVSRERFPDLFQHVSANLTVLPAGEPAANPVDLLASPRAGVMLDALQHRFDRIVLDAPPVLGLSDAPILARLADAVLMVVSARQVDRRAASFALSHLRAAHAQVVGAALTKTRAADFESAYSYGYASDRPYGARPPARAAWDFDGVLHEERPSTAAKLADRLGGLLHRVMGLRKRSRYSYR